MGRGRYKAKVERVGDVLQRWIKFHRREGGLQEYSVRERWPEVVGPQLSQRTQPQSLRDGLLTVVVVSASWLNELSFMRTTILQRLNELLGQGTVRAVRLVAGRVTPPPQVAPPPAEPPAPCVPPEDVERIEREVAAQVADPQLREAVRLARVAHLGRLLRFKD